MNNYSLTAANGEGQQWRAAPACTASTELETKGSLDMSALTKMKFLKTEILIIVVIVIWIKEWLK